jgi:hypothetical protein
MNKIEVPLAQVEFMENIYIEQLERETNEDYSSVKLKPELEKVLTMLRDAFSDNDPRMVNVLVNSYRMGLYKNEKLTLYEIDKLLRIKKNNPEFSIKLDKDSYYNGEENNIHLEHAFPTVLSHEIGHSLLHNLTDLEVLEELYEIIERIRNNPKTIRRMADYTSKIKVIKECIYRQINDIYNSVYPEMDKIIELNGIRLKNRKFFDIATINREDELNNETIKSRKSIKSFVEKSKEEKRKMLLEKGYDKETVDRLLNTSFTLSEYILQHKKIQKKEIVHAISSALLEDDLAIGDFYDAVFRGEYSADKLKDENGSSIKGVS